ncbi:MAG: hypothetical protein ACXWT7_05505 [Methylophilaceae bacterium]
MKQVKGIKLAVALIAGSLMLTPLTSSADIFGVLKAVGDALQEGQPQAASNSSDGPAKATSTEATQPADSPQIGPEGIEATCKQVMVIDEPSSADVFNVKVNDWTPETVTFLNGVVDRCFDGALESMDKRPYETNKVSYNMSRANAKQSFRFAYVAAVNAKREAKNKECYKSPSFLFYAKQDDVVNMSNHIAELREVQARERKITKESGVRDLAKERSIGEGIVRYTEIRAGLFNEYKRMGGKELTADKVTKNLANPCL